MLDRKGEKMDHSKIRDLKQEIVLLKRKYKQEKHQVNLEYRAARKTIAQYMVLARKEETKSPEFQTVTSQGRISYALDSVTLRLCEPFVKKHTDILYHRENPEGWEADHLVTEIREIIKFYDKRPAAGKELKPKDMEVLLKIHTALTTIVQRNAGQCTDEAFHLKSILENMLPPTALDSLKQIDQIFDQAQNMMGEMFNRMGIPCPVTPENTAACAPSPQPEARMIPLEQGKSRIAKLIDILEKNPEPQPQGA